MSFQDFRNRHPIGSLVEVDHTPPKNPYQCVDLIKDYFIEEFQMPNKAYGNALAYWYNTAPEIFQHFNKITGSNALAGDIVVLETNHNPIRYGQGDGHIGLATGNVNASQVEILEQNGATGNGLGQGNDRIRTRWVPRTRVAGLLRPTITPSQHVETVTGAGKQYYVRSGPSTNDAQTGKVVRSGESYATEVMANGWRKITKDGIAGYVGPAAFR